MVSELWNAAEPSWPSLYNISSRNPNQTHLENPKPVRKPNRIENTRNHLGKNPSTQILQWCILRNYLCVYACVCSSLHDTSKHKRHDFLSLQLRSCILWECYSSSTGCSRCTSKMSFFFLCPSLAMHLFSSIGGACSFFNMLFYPGVPSCNK